MKTFLIFLLSFLLITGCCLKQSAKLESLSDAIWGFEHVQDSARTKVWWFHGETETTREGITADLEAFKKAGVGGVVYYDQSHGKAENALPGFSKEWWEMLRFSAEEAERLGLSFEIHISNGFVAGGPWITGETGMKRLLASETIINGGHFFEDTLATPKNRFKFYKDVAVLAFSIDENVGTSLTESNHISSNLQELDAKQIFNPQASTLTVIPAKENQPVYINIEFEHEFTARCITYEVRPQGKATTSATNIPGESSDVFVGTGYRVLPDLGQLEVSQDGINYTKVCDLKPIYRAHENWRQKTISFNAVKGKYYRLNLHDWWDDEMNYKNMQLGSIVLHSSAKVDQWEEKAGLFAEYIEKDKTPLYNQSEVINKDEIINLTDKMDSLGVLRWDVPAGKWMVLRFAYVPTGGSTKHGRKNLLGRECDKLSASAVQIQWDNYVGRINDSLKISGSGKLIGVAMDSHEAGAQNWTDDFMEQFSNRQGYDPLFYLPAMMGYVVNSSDESNGFLFDVRRNIADLISDNYYGTIDSLCRANDLVFTAQAIGNALCIAGDPIQAKSRVNKPQGEFWGIHPDGNYDIKESSSAAHLYGKKIASAEAYTDIKYNASLAELKSLADYAYAFGINEFVVCASAYQPWLDKMPGNTGGGRHYAVNRNNTWWDYSQPFWDYQARCAYVMRQGKSVSDLCVYLGENAPVKILTYRLPDIPGGYDFDAFSTDALLTRMQVKNGKIVLPDGVEYRMLILPRNGDITLPALRKIADLLKGGACVYGERPILANPNQDKKQAEEYNALVDKIWGKINSTAGRNLYGKGTIYYKMSLTDALQQANINPDVEMEEGNTKDSMIYFAHRKLNDANLYFLHNHKDRSERNRFIFNSSGKYAQLWDATSGKRYALPVIKLQDGRVAVDLHFAPRESFLIIITDNNENLSLKEWNADEEIDIIQGAWNVFFDEKKGGPGEIILDTLIDWTNHTNPGIKYYSGTAIYKKDINIDKSMITDKQILLELPDLSFVARVFINGREAELIWCSPWQTNITNLLQAGKNKLEIHVANSLINRMIYDSSLSEENRITYAYPIITKPTDVLEPSGLKSVRMIRK